MGIDNFLRFQSSEKPDQTFDYPTIPEKVNSQAEKIPKEIALVEEKSIKIGDFVRLLPGNKRLARDLKFLRAGPAQRFKILDIFLNISNFPNMFYEYKIKIGPNCYWLKEEDIAE